jgi:predicted nucleotidyltransferase
MTVRQIAKVTYGSHLFGINTPESDFDYKVIALPSAEDILLGRTMVSSRDGTTNVLLRNLPGDVDYDTFDLLKFVELLISATPEALEILFAPDEMHHGKPMPVFRELQRNHEKIVSANSGKFLGLCRNQAQKFGIRGEKRAAAEACFDILKEMRGKYGRKTLLIEHLPELLERTANDYVHLETVVSRDGRHHELLTLCVKSLPISDTIGRACDIAEKVVQNYGERARKTASTRHDWKAYSHALRVGYELKELLSEGKMTLPGPYAARLLDVKLGRVSIEEVGEQIEEMMDDLERLNVTTSIRQEPDSEFLYDLVCQEHLRHLRTTYGHETSAVSAS